MDMQTAPLLTGISITAAFIGGMVALFAPCCITFLFPAYIGTIFKEKGKVVFYTLIFSLGLASILVPVAVGFRFIITLFDQFHTTTYLIGALIMVLVGIATLFEAKLNLPFIPRFQMPKQMTVGSTYLLGIFSGITSSCCAPVLFAAITLSSLSPTLLSSVVISLVYVLGIVFPLFFLSLIFEKLTNANLFNLKKKVGKPLIIIAGFTFITSGILIAYFALSGKLVMNSETDMYGQNIRTFMYSLTDRFGNSFIDVGIFLLILTVLIVFIKRAIYEEKHNS